MKSITLIDKSSIERFASLCQNILDSGKKNQEMVLKATTESATLAQFKAIFGAWFKYLQDSGARSKEYYHKKYKLMFLVKIYDSEPNGLFQNLWSENVTLWTERGDSYMAARALNRISLSWATREQMCAYMRDIEIYHIEIGEPLPPIENEEYRKSYLNFCKRLGLK